MMLHSKLKYEHLSFILCLLTLWFVEYLPVGDCQVCLFERQCAGYDQETLSAYCLGYEACINGSWSIVSISNFYGSHAGESSDITTFARLFCGGESGCRLAKRAFCHAGFILCNGLLSCADTPDLQAPYAYITCASDHACANSIISNTPIIRGRGPFSLNGATINTYSGISSSTQLSHSESVTVIMSGYLAGVNLTLNCENGITCIVYCFGNACLGMKINDNGASRIIISCDNRINNLCPNAIAIEDFVSQVNPNHNDLLTLGLADKVDEINDYLCENGDAVTFDGFQDTNGSVFDWRMNSTDNYICVRGSQALRGVDAIINNNDIFCFAGHSCAETTIFLDGNSNSNNNSNSNSNSSTTKKVTLYCAAWSSCHESEIYGDEYGSDSSQTAVYFGAERSGLETNISSVDSVYCATGQREIGCTGLWNKIRNIYFTGPFDWIATGNVHYGDLTINSGGIGNMNVYFWSYQSGINVTINCSIENQDNCYIDCGTVSQACHNEKTLIYCYGNCAIKCNDNNGFTCPNVIQMSNSSRIDYYTAFAPTGIPTASPTMSPTTMPSKAPTIAPTKTPTDALTLSQEMAMKIEDVASYLVWGTFVFIFIGIVFTFCYHRFVLDEKSQDNKKLVSIAKCGQNCGDFWTDILFAYVLYLQEFNILFFFSGIFVIVPFIFSCISCMYWILQWKYKREIYGTRIKKYLDKYEWFVIAMTIIAGFHAAIELSQSKLFFSKMLNMPFRKKETNTLKHWKFVNVVLLEVCYFCYFVIIVILLF